jgi:hypothetical protein
MPNVQSVYFGRSPKSFDDGGQPACAINSSGFVVEMHQGVVSGKLFYRIAKLNGLSLEWKDLQNGDRPPSFDDGFNPSVALTAGLTVVEVHDSGDVDPKLFYSVRRVEDGLKLSSATPKRIGDETASNPSVAVNADGVAVEVHKAGSGLKYRVQTLSGQTLDWPDASVDLVGNGGSPSVAINDSGRVVVVYQDGSSLRFITGSYTAATATIQWNSATPYDTGSAPSVALTNDRWVYEVHADSGALFQRVGRLSEDGKTIDWMAWLTNPASDDRNPSYQFDAGATPAVATNGVVAVQVHKDEAGSELFTTASAIFDRGHWMEDHLDDLRNRTLAELVIPGSHDAGQYTNDIPVRETRTQTLPIYGQLAYGVRYFDLRPFLKNGQIHIHHDIQVGVRFQEVLDDVAAFMASHRELVILKISHYGEANEILGTTPEENGSWSQAAFNQMVGQIQASLGRYLPQGPSMRIAKFPLKTFLVNNVGAVLVVTNTAFEQPEIDYLSSAPTPAGIYRYRDWEATSPKAGDLRVFDIFGNTQDFDDMVDGSGKDPSGVKLRDGKHLKQGQYRKFDVYDGKCLNQQNGQDVGCDLFLLSWTLTPKAPTAVDNAAKVSRLANVDLVDKLTAKPTSGTKIFNILYTDVVQDSRSSDVAFLRNGLLR